MSEIKNQELLKKGDLVRTIPSHPLTPVITFSVDEIGFQSGEMYAYGKHGGFPFKILVKTTPLT